MSSETTKRQLAWVEAKIERWGRAADETQELVLWFQAKLALVQCLEIQERMEREAKTASVVPSAPLRIKHLQRCPACKGEGAKNDDYCLRCNATGVLPPDGNAGGGE